MHPKSDVVDPLVAFPPMIEVKRKLKIDWYRCPLKRSSLNRLIRKDEGRAWAHALGHLGLWCATAMVSVLTFEAGIWWLFVPALLAHGVVGSFLTAPHHELCHRTVFNNQEVGEWFLRVFSLLGWLNFHVYRFSHNYHHRYTLFLEGDREEVMPVTPSLRAMYILQLLTLNLNGGYHSRGLLPALRGFLNLARNRFDNPFNSWGPELYAGHDKQRGEARRWAQGVLAFHAAVAVLSILSGHPIVAVVVSLSPFIANLWRYLIGATQHCGLQANVSDFRKCARTVLLDPVSEFLYWHMNWHLEHHMYAAVPCYKLAALHQELASDMPVPRTLLGAWKEMRDTWRRQQIDPDYAFDTPLPAA